MNRRSDRYPRRKPRAGGQHRGRRPPAASVGTVQRGEAAPVEAEKSEHVGVFRGCTRVAEPRLGEARCVVRANAAQAADDHVTDPGKAECVGERRGCAQAQDLADGRSCTARCRCAARTIRCRAPPSRGCPTACPASPASR